MEILNYHIEKLNSNPDLKLQEKIWNNRADTYGEKTRIFEKSPITKLVDVLVKLEGKTVLDIGSGTGKYLIEMTKLGAHLEGVELAPKMIERAEENIKLNGLEEIKIYNSSWEDFETDKSYDLTFLCQSPALSSYQMVKKMIDLSNRHVIIVSHLRHEDSFFDQLAENHYKPRKTKDLPDIYHIFNALFLEGYIPEFRTKEFVDINHVDIEMDLDRYIHWLFKGQEKEEDITKLKKILNDYQKEGEIKTTRRRTLGIIYLDKEKRRP